MTMLVPLSVALALALATTAIAQTSATPAAAAPSATASPAASSPTTAPPDVVLTEAEARNRIDKTVYSSDNKNVGEVAAFKRDSSGKVAELHADVGGFLGIGERRVKLMPGQFSLQGDRVVLNMTSEEVKALPAFPKS